jgi:hypothetical protein
MGFADLEPFGSIGRLAHDEKAVFETRTARAGAPRSTGRRLLMTCPPS